MSYFELSATVTLQVHEKLVSLPERILIRGLARNKNYHPVAFYDLPIGQGKLLVTGHLLFLASCSGLPPPKPKGPDPVLSSDVIYPLSPLSVPEPQVPRGSLILSRPYMYVCD